MSTDLSQLEFEFNFSNISSGKPAIAYVEKEQPSFVLFKNLLKRNKIQPVPEDTILAEVHSDTSADSNKTRKGFSRFFRTKKISPDSVSDVTTDIEPSTDIITASSEASAAISLAPPESSTATKRSTKRSIKSLISKLSPFKTLRSIFRRKNKSVINITTDELESAAAATSTEPLADDTTDAGHITSYVPAVAKVNIVLNEDGTAATVTIDVTEGYTGGCTEDIVTDNNESTIAEFPAKSSKGLQYKAVSAMKGFKKLFSKKKNL